MGRGGRRERNGSGTMAEQTGTRAWRYFGVDDEKFGKTGNDNEIDKVETGHKKE